MSALAADCEVICTMAMNPDGDEALYGEDDAFIAVAEYGTLAGIDADQYRAEGCTAVRHRMFRDDAPFYGDTSDEWDWPEMLPSEWLVTP